MSNEQSENPNIDVPPPPPTAIPDAAPPVDSSSQAPPPAPNYSGAPASPPVGQISEKKLVAGLFALLLGCFGIHKFYLGYQTEGIIMLVISVVGWFLCGIPTLVIAVIAIVEGILYLTKTNEEFDRIYVHGRKPWF